MTDNAVVIAALQCDYYQYAIRYIGSVAVLPCKRGNSSVIYKNHSPTILFLKLLLILVVILL